MRTNKIDFIIKLFLLYAKNNQGQGKVEIKRQNEGK